MLIYDIDEKTPIDEVPYYDDYIRYTSQLTEDELNAIFDEFDKYFEGRDIIESSFVPGSDWSGTVYDPIFKKPAKKDHYKAAMIFGLLLCKYVVDRDDYWSATKNIEINGFIPNGTLYFKINPST